MELPQNLLQILACVASEKKLPTKTELPQIFLQTCACVDSKKPFLPEMELPQNLLQTFADVPSKKTCYQKWSCLKIYCKLLLV